MSSNHHDPTEPARKLAEHYENVIHDLEERLRAKDKALEALRRSQDEMAYQLGRVSASVDQAIEALKDARRKLTPGGEETYDGLVDFTGKPWIPGERL